MARLEDIAALGADVDCSAAAARSSVAALVSCRLAAEMGPCASDKKEPLEHPQCHIDHKKDETKAEQRE